MPLFRPALQRLVLLKYLKFSILRHIQLCWLLNLILAEGHFGDFGFDWRFTLAAGKRGQYTYY